MIRNMMVSFKTMNEDVFAATMADFYQTYRGKKASTEDFQAIVEKHMGVGLRWFFHDWFDQAAMPTYVLSWHADPTPDGKSLLKFKVRQEGVPEDLFMPVSLRIGFADGTDVMIRINVRGKEVVGEIALPAASARLELNALESVLARVKEKGWKPGTR
jgi:aminopeptidase N